MPASDAVCRVPEVHVGEYSLAGDGTVVVCTPSELRYGSPGGERTIRVEDVERLVTDRTEALTGFRRLGLVFAGFGFAFAALSLLFVVRGVALHPVALGAYLATGLSWYGAVDVYRVDAGPLDVLEVHAAGRRHVFLAREGRLDGLASALADLAPDAGEEARSTR